MTKSSQKSVKIVYLFWNLHTLECKENIYLEYMNINHEPVAFQDNYADSKKGIQF